jgi:hypothetical protein
MMMHRNLHDLISRVGEERGEREKMAEGSKRLITRLLPTSVETIMMETIDDDDDRRK